MTKQNKIVVGAVAAIAGVIVFFLVFRKKAKADPVRPEPDQPEPKTPVHELPYIGDPDPVLLDPVESPEPEPDPIEIEISAPDPYNPTGTPTKGRYYAVEKGDTMWQILGRAGFEKGNERHKAYRAMLTHERNAWIGTEVRGGDEVLRFNQRFEPSAGYEDEEWAWGTDYVPNVRGKWPCVYVIIDGELIS